MGGVNVSFNLTRFLPKTVWKLKNWDKHPPPDLPMSYQNNPNQDQLVRLRAIFPSRTHCSRIEFFLNYQHTKLAFLPKIFIARKWNCGKVMFLHLSIILFTGVFHDATSCGTPLRLAPPPLRTAPPKGWHPTPTYGWPAGGTHPTWMLSCSFLIFPVLNLFAPIPLCFMLHLCWKHYLILPARARAKIIFPKDA